MTMVRAFGQWWLRLTLAALLLLGLTACGGGVEEVEAQKQVSGADEVLIRQAGTGPKVKARSTGEPTTLTIHYQRPAGDYTDPWGGRWQAHVWGAARGVDWNAGLNPDRFDDFGAVYEVPLASSTGTVGYLFHKWDEKDHGGADQGYTLQPGKNEIWRIQGDPVTYTRKPGGPVVPDIETVRVHYKRYGADYAAWGLHLWNGSGLDAARMPAGVAIDQWSNAVGFDRMPGYRDEGGWISFDIPVLNPQGDASRSALEFIIHGKAPNENDKDGRNDNIRVLFGNLDISARVGQIWMVQGDPTVYTREPDLRRVSSLDARAFFLNRSVIQWPANDGSGRVRLYHSRNAQLLVALDQPVSGADGFIELERFGGVLPAEVATRFAWLGAGARLQIPVAAQGQLRNALKGQLLIVQETADGKVQNATALQHAGALDDLYAAAASEPLGVLINGNTAEFRLWAPTAQRVRLLVETADGRAQPPREMAERANTGIWRTGAAGVKGLLYRYEVTTFVRGIGIVRNVVTDPYSISLNANSQRSYIGALSDPALKPAGWDASRIPDSVKATTDMSIYELHVRDFSINDPTVSAANRGKYLAFTENGSNGMRHLQALATAGLTDVHLLPTYDLASIPEVGCTTPAISGGPADESQQAAVQATRGSDCFNWGYDPWHFNAPEGSYASTAQDPAARIVEFRRMIQALHGAGLRVGLDVVFNHTSASGQNSSSVLDRIVPGYYHRYNANGDIERSTCCDNTATENLMMAKLMSDSTLLWAREYKIASFRFDIMGHQPRAAMEAMQRRLRAELGREVQLLGEGWNFGEVADGRRFVQASMWSLNGSGIGTFSPFARDAIRGGGPMDGGNSLVANQGFVNGLWYDPNSLGGGKSRNDLMWQGDLIKAGLAGSIRSFTVLAHWGETKRLEELNGAGYVVEPGEVVNYIENHDNQTLFDNNAFKLPQGTSREDRARVQMLAAALNSFSQGVAYFHAGVDTLRSKSLDRNSYDAGDWFNRIDWSYYDNYFGTGLPLASDNRDNWSVMRPLLADASIKPQPADIAWTRDVFRDLLKIRASTTLLRLRTADDIKARLKFHNVGPSQEATVLMAAIDGSGYAGANFAELVYLVNVDKTAKSITVDALRAKGFRLHPVQASPAAADRRVALEASYDDATGRFNVPARSAVVFVR